MQMTEATSRRHPPPMHEEDSLPTHGPVAQVLGRVAFQVYGLPVPQGSTRAFVVKGRPIITSTSKGLPAWRHLVSSEAQRHARTPFEGPVAVQLEFSLPKPKSAPKKRFTYPTKRPDLDKLVRSVLDGITHVLVRDDSQVVSITATKEYGPPGVHIIVEEIGLG